MIASVAGEIEGGALTDRRPFRRPHDSGRIYLAEALSYRLRGRPAARSVTLFAARGGSWCSVSSIAFSAASRSPTRGNLPQGVCPRQAASAPDT
jgi:hypothetical protein